MGRDGIPAEGPAMIELTLTEMALAVLTAALVMVGLFSLISRWKHAADERLAARRRLICRDCGHAWEDDGRERIAPCPDCGVLNSKGRDRRLG